jgi:hypothetical protein
MGEIDHVRESFKSSLSLRVAARPDEFATIKEQGLERRTPRGFDPEVRFGVISIATAGSVRRACPDRTDDEKTTNQGLACLQNNPPPAPGYLLLFF